VSAIFGLVSFNEDLPDRGVVSRMAAALAHHGRDGVIFEQSGAAVLGICLNRLRSIDRNEVQPVEDGSVQLVASARLDNRVDLARALSIPNIDDVADSALILAAYREWGENCAAQLLGDFAFAIWNGATGRLLLARDHMGQRPLLYHVGDGFIVFAPEPKALWVCPEVPRILTDAAIGRRLMHQMGDAPGATPFEGIRSLPGGHRLVASRDATGALRVEITSYWTPAPDPAHLNQDEAYYVRAYREVLGEAVACRLRGLTDPPGLYLSGGYDSSAVAGLARTALAKGQTLVAASSVMPKDYRGTIRHAGRWVDLCARDMPWLNVLRVTREGLDALTNHDRNLTERGGASSYTFVQDALNEVLANAGVRQVMDGHGGDYTLNPRGEAALARLWKTRQWRRFPSELGAHRRMTGRSWRTIANRDILPHIASWLLPRTWRKKWRRQPPWAEQPVRAAFAQRLVAEGVIDPAQLRSTPRPQTAMRVRMDEAIGRARDGGGGGDVSHYGMILTRPFHDKRVVELALAIPEDLYVVNGRNRYLACRALAEIYPAEFQKRGRRNDDAAPDFQAMVSRIKPRLLADIARMEQSVKLSTMIDFAKIRALLDVRGPDDHNSGWEQESQIALDSYMVARFVEWFRRDNR